MAPFEVLYGHRCRTPLNWIEPREKILFGLHSTGSSVSKSFTYEGRKEGWAKGKLEPHYVGHFPILEKCGNVAYKLELPQSLVGVYDIFHILQLKKCLKAPVDVVLPNVTPLEADLTYPEHPIKILDQKDRVTRRKMNKFFKIQWSNHSKDEATWENEDFLHSRHLDYELP
jgi:hypothetical protein